ncbi:signal peptidase I, partial [Streptomyces sp. DSM 41859]|nr:signal peptidase I [Streptomyces sp. DSM 41859]
MTTEDGDHATVVNDDDDAGSQSSHPSEPPAKKADRRAHKRDEKKHLPLWQETVLLLGIALLLAIVIKAFFVQAFYI